MAAALRFAATKICGRALQRPPQQYLTAVAEAAIKEEQRQLLRHAGSTLRRFSTESQNLVKNNKLGAMSGANSAAASPPINNAQATSPPPIWSPRNKMFLPLAAGYVTALCAGISGILYYCTHEERGPFFEPRKKQSD